MMFLSDVLNAQIIHLKNKDDTKKRHDARLYSLNLLNAIPDNLLTPRRFEN